MEKLFIPAHWSSMSQGKSDICGSKILEKSADFNPVVNLSSILEASEQK